MIAVAESVFRWPTFGCRCPVFPFEEDRFMFRRLDHREIHTIVAYHESHRFDHWGVLWLSLSIYCDWPR